MSYLPNILPIGYMFLGKDKKEEKVEPEKIQFIKLVQQVETLSIYKKEQRWLFGKLLLLLLFHTMSVPSQSRKNVCLLN